MLSYTMLYSSTMPCYTMIYHPMYGTGCGVLRGAVGCVMCDDSTLKLRLRRHTTTPTPSSLRAPSSPTPSRPFHTVIHSKARLAYSPSQESNHHLPAEWDVGNGVPCSGHDFYDQQHDDDADMLFLVKVRGK